ncbi:hypothetical protein BU24DRAFT_462955 [Aaosphaeria arxii CBS 175.79]|uniref:Rhodopsin domain-containing protein n=1 Tax=Aaosphaeria arxii CBS 175.79 TaxID=1450172 RepID=A0A6A5XMH0_9PLEO|nr:uncharacterized protein BU24DRAFT_462955 [Aaosphaeria arxii CBS 175.79]KAF2014143.1 hypothetical protein BU24DRAFT_462955 [Aaosphaeria arxii CBS 175.79]
MSFQQLPTAADFASWPPPNFIDPETRRPLVLGIEIPLLCLIVIFTMMRFYSRAVLIRALGADDWCMLVATVISVATSIMTCISTQAEYQTGYHIWDLRPEIAANPVKPAQIAMATQLLFIPITALTKVSILLTYLRIFPSTTNKYFCYCMFAFTAIWSLISFFLALFQCKPIEAYWLLAKYPNRECIDIAPLFYTTGGLNILSDFLIFLWPAKDLAKIRISLKQRVTLIIMFTLGVIICVAGVCRLWYTSIYIHSYDSSWHGSTLYVIVAIETSIGIICGCIPACKPLMSKIAPRIFNSTHSSTHRSTHKKGSKFAGQSFPFQSLNGGIVVKEGYSVEYDDARSQYQGRHTTTQVTTMAKDADAISADSQEWIMLQDNPQDALAKVQSKGNT